MRIVLQGFVARAVFKDAEHSHEYLKAFLNSVTKDVYDDIKIVDVENMEEFSYIYNLIQRGEYTDFVDKSQYLEKKAEGLEDKGDDKEDKGDDKEDKEVESSQSEGNKTYSKKRK